LFLLEERELLEPLGLFAEFESLSQLGSLAAIQRIRLLAFGGRAALDRLQLRVFFLLLGKVVAQAHESLHLELLVALEHDGLEREEVIAGDELLDDASGEVAVVTAPVCHLTGFVKVV